MDGWNGCSGAMANGVLISFLSFSTPKGSRVVQLYSRRKSQVKQFNLLQFPGPLLLWSSCCCCTSRALYTRADSFAFTHTALHCSWPPINSSARRMTLDVCYTTPVPVRRIVIGRRPSVVVMDIYFYYYLTIQVVSQSVAIVALKCAHLNICCCSLNGWIASS